MLYFLANLANKYWLGSKNLKPLEIITEYEKTVMNELNLMREGANTAQLKRNFEGSNLLYVPNIFWDYCRKEVLVQERIYGIPIRDMEALKSAKTNIKALAENGVEIFFTFAEALPSELSLLSLLDTILRPRASGPPVSTAISAINFFNIV